MNVFLNLTLKYGHTPALAYKTDVFIFKNNYREQWYETTLTYLRSKEESVTSMEIAKLPYQE